MISFSIKHRSESGQWKKLSLDHFAGKTLQQIFMEMDGKEYVAEFDIDGKRCFLCGTDHWLQRMKQKAPAVSFGYAVTRLQETRPDLLGELIPKSLESVLVAEFGGEVEQIELDEEIK